MGLATSKASASYIRMRTRDGAGEHGLEDGADARLSQALGEAVQVRLLALHQQHLGTLDVRAPDGLGGIRDDLLDRHLRQRVDEPGLALGELEGPRDGI